MTFDFEWAELPDDIAHRKQQAWQQWETTDHQLHDPTHPPAPDEQAEAGAAPAGPPGSSTGTPTAPATTSPTARWATPSPSWNRPAWPAASPPHRSPNPPLRRQPARTTTTGWTPSTAASPTQPSAELADYLDARDQHQRANYDAQVIPRHKLWTNDGWLSPPTSSTAALPHAPASATDRRQRPIPWWAQWLDYLDSARGHGGIRVH